MRNTQEIIFARIMYNMIWYAVSNMKWEDEELLQPLQVLTSVSNNNYTNNNDNNNTQMVAIALELWISHPANQAEP